MSDLVCYCFGYTADDIREDVTAHEGRSTIMEKILSEKHAGNCRCREMHPEQR